LSYPVLAVLQTLRAFAPHPNPPYCDRPLVLVNPSLPAWLTHLLLSDHFV